MVGARPLCINMSGLQIEESAMPQRRDRTVRISFDSHKQVKIASAHTGLSQKMLYEQAITLLLEQMSELAPYLDGNGRLQA